MVERCTKPHKWHMLLEYQNQPALEFISDHYSQEGIVQIEDSWAVGQDYSRIEGIKIFSFHTNEHGQLGHLGLYIIHPLSKNLLFKFFLVFFLLPDPTNFPNQVVGAMSPYPTEVIVIIAQYRACNRDVRTNFPDYIDKWKLRWRYLRHWDKHCVLFILFSNIGQATEYQHPHDHHQHQQPQLLVTKIKTDDVQIWR